MVSNRRAEDHALDPFDFRIGVWLSSHTDAHLRRKVSTRWIATHLALSDARVRKSLLRLAALGVVTIETVPEVTCGERTLVTFHRAAWDAPRWLDQDDVRPFARNTAGLHAVPATPHATCEPLSRTARAPLAPDAHIENHLENQYSSSSERVSAWRSPGEPDAAAAVIDDAMRLYARVRARHIAPRNPGGFERALFRDVEHRAALAGYLDEHPDADPIAAVTAALGVPLGDVLRVAS